MTGGLAPSVLIYLTMDTEYILIILPRSFLLRASKTLNIDATIYDMPSAPPANMAQTRCYQLPQYSYLITLSSSAYRAHHVLHQEKGKSDLSDLDGLNMTLYGLMVFFQANLPCFKPISLKSIHIKPR